MYFMVAILDVASSSINETMNKSQRKSVEKGATMQVGRPRNILLSTESHYKI